MLSSVIVDRCYTSDVDSIFLRWKKESHTSVISYIRYVRMRNTTDWIRRNESKYLDENLITIRHRALRR